MADATVPHRAALPAGPVVVAPHAVTLLARPEGHVLAVAARKGRLLSPEDLAGLGDGRPHAVRPNGPGQWLVVGDTPLSADEVATRADRLSGAACVFDLGHGRVRLAVTGPDAADRLATGVAIDLHDGAFPVGSATPCLFRHVAIHLCRTGDDGFEIIVARSVSADLWHALGG